MGHGVGGRAPRPATARQQHDRCGRRLEEIPGRWVQLHVGGQPGRIGHQQGEGPGRPPLAPPQPGHRRPVAGIHQQLEATHPLQRQDPARSQQRRRIRHQPGAAGRRRFSRVAGSCRRRHHWLRIRLRFWFRPQLRLRFQVWLRLQLRWRLQLRPGHPGSRPGRIPAIHQGEPGPAGRAADRFSVEASIGWIGELHGAGRAGNEGRQGGVGAAPGFGGGDRVAGAAGAAGEEGITAAAAAGIFEFAAAGRAGGPIGHQAAGHKADAERHGRGGRFGADRESRGTRGRRPWWAAPSRTLDFAGGPVRLEGLQPGCRRQSIAQRGEEALEVRPAADQIKPHSLRTVVEASSEAQPAGQAMHGGPEAHALHHPPAVQAEAGLG